MLPSKYEAEAGEVLREAVVRSSIRRNYMGSFLKESFNSSNQKGD
jgi:hypothetical protein